MIKLHQILQKINQKIRRTMTRRERNLTRMMMMKIKKTTRRLKRSLRSQGTFLQEGYPIHLRRLLKNKNSSCKLERMP